MLGRAFGASALLLGLAGVGAWASRADAEGTPWRPTQTDGRDEVATSLTEEASKLEATNAPAESKPTPAPTSGITADGKVVLNTASAEEFDRLPGVGAVRARAIVELRTRLKRFRRPSDLLRVRGIGPRSLQRMLPHLVVDPPEPPAASAAPPAGSAAPPGSHQ